jgi:hypothetical protein
VYTCSVHPTERAGWRCTSCERALCPACAAAHGTLRGEIVRCAGCGALAEPLLVPPSDIAPFTETWPHALLPALTPLGLGMVAVSSLSAEYLQRMGTRAWLLGWFLELGWFLTVLRRAGRGYPPFGPPTWSDLATLVPGPMGRLLVALFPFVLGAALLGGLGAQQLPPGLPWLWLLALGAAWLLPAALLTATVEGEGARWRLPWQLPAEARPHARDLGPLRVAAALFVACEVAQGLLPRLQLNDTKMADKILLGALVHAAATLTLGALACLTGLLLRTHAHALGHGELDRRLVPVLGDARPSGTVREKPAPPPIEVAPIDLEDPREGLLAALARGDGEGAVQRYRSGLVRPDALDGPVHVEVARLLVGRGEVEAGANALRGLLLRTPQAAVAPQAMVLLARLLAERLGREEEARALFAQVVERFPGTEAARFAQGRLG